MSALKNKRHEQFAQELVIALKLGGSQGNAYSRAGYSSTGNAAEACASQLLSNPKAGIRQRVAELTRNGAKRAEVTVQSLLNELEDARAGASDDRQFGAATGAIIAKAKLKGLMIDRSEIGAPGAFSNCESPSDLVREMLRDQTPAEALAALDALRDAIEQHAGDRAILLNS
jgi:hypothetical protein